MAQFSLPSSDASGTDNWVETGNGNGDFYDEVNHGFGLGRGTGTGPDDATYWTSDRRSLTSDMFLNMGPAVDPGIHTGHIMRLRARRFTGAVNRIELAWIDPVNGVIATLNTGPLTNWLTYTLALAEAQAALITDYAGIDVRIDYAQSSDDVNGRVRVAEIEIQLPVGVVTAVEPPEGPVNGGAPVRITGVGFIGVTSVTFDGLLATNITVVDDGLIKCNTPPHRTGLVDIAVDGASLVAAYTYVGPRDRYHVGPTGSDLVDHVTADDRVAPFQT